MTTNEYLQAILNDQTLPEKGKELEQLRDRRKDVEALLRRSFPDSALTIRYGGSYAKGTMILAAYDLDLIAYLAANDETAGSTLKNIFTNMAAVLFEDYYVEQKTSALRLKSKDPTSFELDFHIDVVPGRYTDEAKTDSYLYISVGEKGRLKTNLNVHLEHVTESGVIDAIRLLKLWRARHGVTIKHFALELLTIDLLKTKKRCSLEEQLLHVWTAFRDDYNDLTIEDPANPTGNDLSFLLDECVRHSLASTATGTLITISRSGWETVFGPVTAQIREKRVGALKAAAASVTTPSKPWCRCE